jgi:hypothetical protein
MACWWRRSSGEMPAAKADGSPIGINALRGWPDLCMARASLQDSARLEVSGFALGVEVLKVPPDGRSDIGSSPDPTLWATQPLQAGCRHESPIARSSWREASGVGHLDASPAFCPSVRVWPPDKEAILNYRLAPRHELPFRVQHPPGSISYRSFDDIGLRFCSWPPRSAWHMTDREVALAITQLTAKWGMVAGASKNAIEDTPGTVRIVIGTSPAGMSLEKEIQLVKPALLYGDRVVLYSPTASLLTIIRQLGDLDEDDRIDFVLDVMPHS